MGHCQYLHKVRPGSSLTYKEGCVLVTYRRYLRLFPPNEEGELRALLLQDAAPIDVALPLLMSTCPKSRAKAKEQKSPLEKKLFVASYEYHPDEVKLKYCSENGEYNLVLKIAHSKEGHFSEQLEWIDYTLTRPGDGTHQYDLGRNEWGHPKNPSRDHFPPFVLRRQSSLEHHL